MRLFELRYTDQNVGGTFVSPSAIVSIEAGTRGTRIRTTGDNTFFDNRTPEFLVEALGGDIPLHPIGGSVWVNLDHLVALTPHSVFDDTLRQWRASTVVMMDDQTSLACDRSSASALADLLALESWNVARR